MVRKHFHCICENIVSKCFDTISHFMLCPIFHHWLGQWGIPSTISGLVLIHCNNSLTIIFNLWTRIFPSKVPIRLANTIWIFNSFFIRNFSSVLCCQELCMHCKLASGIMPIYDCFCQWYRSRIQQPESTSPFGKKWHGIQKESLWIDWISLGCTSVCWWFH